MQNHTYKFCCIREFFDMMEIILAFQIHSILSNFVIIDSNWNKKNYKLERTGCTEKIYRVDLSPIENMSELSEKFSSFLYILNCEGEIHM